MSEGEVHEAMNFAKVHEVPAIFVCENNQWAISIPRNEQTKSLNFAVKSIGSGVPSLKVDGNDFLACYGVFKEVSQWVREGNGPFFIECETYRLGPHSSADNPDIYRDPNEFESAKTRDPLIRLKAYLIKNKVWSDAEQEALDNEHDQYVK
jgi:pyruvate dehydrogenase E1 component alpha subunit